MPEGTSVDTIAVPAVLAVFNWPKGHDRYRRVSRMVESMFTNWEKFRQPPRHPKWRDVNLAATVPGWTRWSVAEEMLRKMQPDGAGDPKVASGDFATFLFHPLGPFADLVGDTFNVSPMAPGLTSGSTFTSAFLSSGRSTGWSFPSAWPIRIAVIPTIWSTPLV